MADSAILRPFILSWEGGFANHPKDPGGSTMKGITLATFKAVYGTSKTVDDLKKITDEQWQTVYKKYYWDRWKADEIKSQSVANLLVDWVWASGVHGITKVQQLLGVTVDGVVGPKTLGALNSINPAEAFRMIWERRKRFIESLSNYATFGNGWMNRLNSIKFCHLICNEYKRLNGVNVWRTIIFNDLPPHRQKEEWLTKS